MLQGVASVDEVEEMEAQVVEVPEERAETEVDPVAE